jgi:HEAT repeat protein
MRLATCCAVALVLATTAVVSGQEPERPDDPVKRLGQALRAPARDAAMRETQLQAAVQRLNTLDEMRHALQLSDWHDLDSPEDIAAADSRQRTALVERFERTLRAELRENDQIRRLAAVRLLGELDTKLCGVDGAPLTRAFGRDLGDLTGPGPASLRELAAHTLGRTSPDAGPAAATLGGLLSDADARLRAAAAEALGGLVRTAVAAAMAPAGRDMGNVEVIRTAAAVAPAATRGLTDASGDVRRLCSEALTQVAEAFAALVAETPPAEEIDDWPEYQHEVEQERAALRPLITAVRDLSVELARSAADTEAPVRIQTRHTLECLAGVRLRLLKRASSAVAAPDGRGDAAAANQSAQFLLDDPLLDALRRALPALGGAVNDDPDVESRKAAIDALEALGRPAAPAVPALLTALRSSDRFLRWSAARALGRVRPTNAEPVVNALTALLHEHDRDLELAAISALAAYGTAARSAVPALLNVPHGQEIVLRLAVLRALASIGSDDPASLGALNAALTDPDGRVRDTAASLLEKVGGKFSRDP